MFVTKTSLFFLSLGSLTGLSDAFWRMSCTIIQTGRIDPVVTPGIVSSHVHKISGASSEYTLSLSLSTQPVAVVTPQNSHIPKS